MDKQKQCIGIVRRGQFIVLAPEEFHHGSFRLTNITPTESTNPESKEINLSEFEDRVIVVNGEFNEKWIYSANIAEEAGPVLSNFLEIFFSKEEREKHLCILVIGHHPDKPGGINPHTQLSEFEFNKKLASLIEQKVNNVRIQKIFRKTYEELPLDINNLNPDFVISLHCNYYDNVTSGTEVLYCHNNPKGAEMGGILLKHLVNHLGLENRGLVSRQEGELGFYVLCKTNAPCVIAEPFFISNDNDLTRAQEDLEGLASAYAQAIEEISKTID